MDPYIRNRLEGGTVGAEAEGRGRRQVWGEKKREAKDGEERQHLLHIVSFVPN